MKSLRKLLYIIPLTGMMVTSCMDVENIEIDHIGGYATMNNAESEAYYANLRAYKATAWNYNRPVAFGWYSNWALADRQHQALQSALYLPVSTWQQHRSSALQPSLPPVQEPTDWSL